MDECLPVVLAKPAPGKHESIFNTLLFWPGILLTPLTTLMINFVLKLLHLMPILVVLLTKNTTAILVFPKCSSVIYITPIPYKLIPAIKTWISIDYCLYFLINNDHLDKYMMYLKRNWRKNKHLLASTSITAVSCFFVHPQKIVPLLLTSYKCYLGSNIIKINTSMFFITICVY